MMPVLARVFNTLGPSRPPCTTHRSPSAIPLTASVTLPVLGCGPTSGRVSWRSLHHGVFLVHGPSSLSRCRSGFPVHRLLRASIETPPPRATAARVRGIMPGPAVCGRERGGRASARLLGGRKAESAPGAGAPGRSEAGQNRRRGDTSSLTDLEAARQREANPVRPETMLGAARPGVRHLRQRAGSTSVSGASTQKRWR